jgi:hypothetical protein
LIRVEWHLLVLGALSRDGIAGGIASVGIHCVLDHAVRASFHPVIFVPFSDPLDLGQLL